jgi:micrococcal nuclease
VLLILSAIFGGDDEESADTTTADSQATETTEPPDESSGESDDQSAGERSDDKPADEESAPTATKTPRPEPVRLYAVTDVVDGDTIKVAYRGETSVRVVGIDTPETVDPSSPVECGGPRASQLASQLLTGKRVQLVFDPSQGRTDRYGRTLAYLDSPGLGDFGLAMIKRGAAAEYTYGTAYARQAQYQSVERQARAAKRGLWGTCGGPHQPLATQAPPATTATPPAGGGGGCADGYSPCVPPYPPDVNCDDVNGPITVTGSDPHGLDADGDGVACES